MPLGVRQVVDVLAEMSFALIEPIFAQTLASPVGPGAALTIALNPASPLPATTYLYPGALVVVGWHGVDAEVVSVIAVTGDNTFTGTLVNAHAAGEQVFSATFSTQQATDPIFTQAEMIGYVAQAQNEFLTKVPLIFELFPNLVINQGQIYQTLPATAIELERVAIQSTPTYFLISSITRSGGTVTAVLQSPVPVSPAQGQWTAQLPILVQGVMDNSYNSLNNATFPLATVSQDGLTLTWAQTGADSTSSGGAVMQPILTRLYEGSQNQLAMQNPNWQVNLTGKAPTTYFEDRTGIYGWGVGPTPPTNYYAELLCSVRGDESLNLLSYFLIPDLFVPYVRYLALAFAWSKAGIQRSPTMARWAQSRYEFGCMLADRFLRNIVEKTGGQQ